MCIRREDAKRFVQEVRGDDPELATHVRIEKRELEAGGPNYRSASVKLPLPSLHV